MQQCSRCGADFNDTLHSCPTCGTVVTHAAQPGGQQAPKNCVSCMEEIPYTALVCPHCKEKQPGRPVGTPQESWLGQLGKLWNSKYCVQCNALIQRDVQACPACGANQDSTPQPTAKRRKQSRQQTWPERLGEFWDSKYCVECNQRIKREDQQCPNCGAHQDGSTHPPPVVKNEPMNMVEETSQLQPAPIASYPTFPVTVLGTQVKTHETVVVSDVDRQSGMYVLGVQGVGKSSFLETIIYSDIYKGYPVIVLDPHGDLIEHVIAQLPEERVKNTYLLDMEDEAFPFGVNLFAAKKSRSAIEEAQAVDRVMHVFEVVWGDVLKQQNLPRYLRAATLTLLQNNGSTLVKMSDLFLDDGYRARLLKQVSDQSVRNFWEYQYNNLTPAARRKEIAPLINRLEALFMGRTLVKNILGQAETTIDFRKSIEEKEIILIKLPMKLVPLDAALIGTMLVAQVHAAIFSFANLPLEKRPGFSFYIDEFQNFVTNDIEEIFTQGRKFGSRLCVAHQGRFQLPEFLASATLTARSIITFQQPEDAKSLGHLYLQQANTIPQENIYPDVAKHLLSYSHPHPEIEKFIKHYVRPLQLMVKGNQIEITTFEQSIGQAVWHGGHTPKPKVRSPLPLVSPLLYEAEIKRDGELPLPYDLLVGFSNCGKGFYNVLEKASKETKAYLTKAEAVSSEQHINTLTSRLAGSKEQIDQLLDFLVTLRLVLHILAKEPLGEKKQQTVSDVVQTIVKLPKRHALVKIGTDIYEMKTLDTPAPVAPFELVKRKTIIQEQTRKKYCRPKDQVEKEFAQRGKKKDQETHASEEIKQDNNATWQPFEEV
jgi:RNA polymerase subunit RPABC4/transcription elongation factor Spt4